MLSNGGERLAIWLTLTNKFDYAEFSASCAKKKIQPQSAAEFAQKAGLLTCAGIMFPDMSPTEAYVALLNFSTENIAQTASGMILPAGASVLPPKPCGNCGGGKVL